MNGSDGGFAQLPIERSSRCSGRVRAVLRLIVFLTRRMRHDGPEIDKESRMMTDSNCLPPKVKQMPFPTFSFWF